MVGGSSGTTERHGRGDFIPCTGERELPIPSDLIPYRMTVQFNRERERRFWLGQWMDSTWSSPGTWVGYSVFKHRDSDAVQGGELCDGGGGCGYEVQPPIRPPIQMTFKRAADLQQHVLKWNIMLSQSYCVSVIVLNFEVNVSHVSFVQIRLKPYAYK